MHQAAISLEQFADIFEHLTECQQTDTGALFTTSGRHPQLGSVVGIQDVNPGMVLLSELPFQNVAA